MIVLPHRHWLRLLFAGRGSVLPRLLPRLALIGGVACLALWLRPWWPLHAGGSRLTVSAFTLMGVTLALFLGFRNTVSYERYWEGRKLWGTLLNSSRSLARQMLCFTPHPEVSEARRQFVRGVAAFAQALAHHLRGSDAGADLERLLPADACERLARADNRPLIVLLWLGKMASGLQQQGRLEMLQLQLLEAHLNTLSEVQGGCERIAGTPFPYTYRVLLTRTVSVYCLLLPFALAASIGWWTPLIACFIAYTFFALDEIGGEIEEPFGVEPNDLPLFSLSYNIEASLHEMLQEPMRVLPPPPERRFNLI